MRILGCLALAIFMVFAATAEKRAFVVGVGEYQNLSDLRKTTGDAQGYSDLFGGELDFEVTKLIDPTQLEFVEAFGTFLEAVNEGDEVVFVFSGHGWTDNAENYLVMSDAPLEASQFALKSQTVPLSTAVLSELKRKNPQLVLAIIDACRENPFDGMTRSLVPVGLVPVQAPEGMLLMFAAGDRQLALDRLNARDESPYSVFTRMLLPLLQDTDRPLQEIARDVKDNVRDLAMTIQHDQRPAYYDELLGDYCLSGKCVSRLSEEDPEMQLWLTASTANIESRCDRLSEYLDEYPIGAFAAEATAMRADALCSEQYEGFREYQSQYAERFEEAMFYLNRARNDYEKQAWSLALDSYNVVVDLHQKFDLFPGRDEILEAYARSIELALDTTENSEISLTDLLEGLTKEIERRATKMGIDMSQRDFDMQRTYEIPFLGEALYYRLRIMQLEMSLKAYRRELCSYEELQAIDVNDRSIGLIRVNEPWLSKIREIKTDGNCNPEEVDSEFGAAEVKITEAIGQPTLENIEEAFQHLDFVMDIINDADTVRRPENLIATTGKMAILISDRLEHGMRFPYNMPEQIRVHILDSINYELEINGLRIEDDLSAIDHGELAFLMSLELRIYQHRESGRFEEICRGIWMTDRSENRFGSVALTEPLLSAARERRESWGCELE